MLNEDYREILQSFNDNNVKYLVVGAYAMGVHGYPRATGDFDIWVLASGENSRQVYKSLAQFGAPMEQVREDTFNEEGLIFQIGVAPRRIDVITRIDGVVFENAYGRRKEIVIDEINVPVISKEDLIKNKEATGRDKDRIDASQLKNTP